MQVRNSASSIKASDLDDIFGTLNPAQRRAVEHDDRPLLILAGAGSGKTNTLVHRLAYLVLRGCPPERICLLTFTRRAAQEMINRAKSLLVRLARRATSREAEFASDRFAWAGTFHAVATALLRRYGSAIGLPQGFVIHDRSDSEDLMDLLRDELGLSKAKVRFPRKETCMDIYSRCVNHQKDLRFILEEYFPWCVMWEKELQQLFDAYRQRKQQMAVVDFDDLLLYWITLLDHPVTGRKVRSLFDYVLVDEYQDTNPLQAEVLYRLSSDGRGLTVVGDDFQAIYSFRGATVKNILEFQEHYPGAELVVLDWNYRSTQPILDAANAVMAEAGGRYQKWLRSANKVGGERPRLVYCSDESTQVNYIVDEVLMLREEHRLALRDQAVLFRAAWQSLPLEAELLRRNIPFHKYGGLKFIETAHIKDVLAFLRLAENPRDEVAGLRILKLLPGIGTATARKLLELLYQADGRFHAWSKIRPPAGVKESWPQLVELLIGLQENPRSPAEEIAQLIEFYVPLIPTLYDNPVERTRDVQQLQLLASRYKERRQFLADLAIDPPNSTQQLVPPDLEEDYLVLSTIHSAKGLEWEAVFILSAVDGCIPSDYAAGNPEQMEEERRLLYVALTRAKRYLRVCVPIRSWQSGPIGYGEWSLAKRSRFLTDRVCAYFDELFLCEEDELEESWPESSQEDPGADFLPDPFPED
ncbi:MAG: ATP-dependent helicase [Thermoguttaceae bacterium]|nr:ATP-dependent helicase [Thermoguttaceae bacterium]MDW8079070.1 ATP-dependent helicase [Thermoguttaceae bacterium]